MPILKSRNTEALNWALAVLAVVMIGFGTAAAAIGIAPADATNPALRPLASGASIQLNSAAYGENDEDCIWTIQKMTQADGKQKQVRGLECAQ